MKKVMVLLMCFMLVFSAGAFAKSKAKKDTKKTTQSEQKSSKSFERAVKGEGDIDWATQTSIITTNPLGLLFGSFNAHYEMAMGKTNGLGFNASILFPMFSTALSSYFGLSAGAEYNWYFQKHALNGWFAGPAAAFIFYSVTYDYTSFGGSKQSASTFGFQLGGHGGYRWIWDGGFTLDVSLSLAYTILPALTFDYGGYSNSVTYGGVWPGIGCNLGYAW